MFQPGKKVLKRNKPCPLPDAENAGIDALRAKADRRHCVRKGAAEVVMKMEMQRIKGEDAGEASLQTRNAGRRVYSHGVRVAQAVRAQLPQMTVEFSKLVPIGPGRVLAGEADRQAELFRVEDRRGYPLVYGAARQSR